MTHLLTPNECRAIRFLAVDGHPITALASYFDVADHTIEPHARGECECPTPNSPTTVAPIVGDQLIAARAEAGFTQAELADAIGVSQSTINHWQNYGATQPPGMSYRLTEVFEDVHVYPNRLKHASTAPLTPGEITRGREIAGINKAELARKVGVSTEAIRQWEFGERVPGRANAYKLRKHLPLDDPDL